MKFEIYNRQTIVNIAPNVPHIIISITNEGKEHPDVPINSNCHGVIRLNFADATPSASYGMKLISKTDAEEILDFVLENFKDVELIICQCDGGISRSSATAGVLSYILNGSDAEVQNDTKYVPNMHVYNTLLRAFVDNMEKYKILKSERFS